MSFTLRADTNVPASIASICAQNAIHPILASECNSKPSLSSFKRCQGCQVRDPTPPNYAGKTHLEAPCRISPGAVTGSRLEQTK